MSVFSKLFGLTRKQDAMSDQADAYSEAIREEAKVGGRVFGPVPEGVRREFFCLDERTWVWHEEWKDADGKKQIRTTRYDVRPHGIFKAQNGQPYQPITREEARNFLAATKRYNEMIDSELEPFLSVA